MNIYYISIILAIIFTGVAQIILKKGAITAKHQSNLVLSYFNIHSIIAYIIFGLVTLLTLFALKQVLVKEMAMLLPINYVIVPVLSRIILKEHISRKQTQGIIIVVVGIIFFNLGALV